MATMGNSVEFYKKIKDSSTLWSAVPFLDIYPKKIKTLIWKDICTPMFIAALFTIARIWKQHECPLIDKLVKKMQYMYIYCIYIYVHIYINTHNGILLSHKKEWNLAICNNTDGATEYNAKQNKSVRKRQIPYDFTHVWNLRKKTD